VRGPPGRAIVPDDIPGHALLCSRHGPAYQPFPVLRYTHPDYQRAYGQALALTDAAEAIVLRAGDEYMERAARWTDGGTPFTREDDVRLTAMLHRCRCTG
jgi:hypothetical protein